MRTWNTLKVGEKVSFHYNDFDGSGVVHGKVTETCEDHVIVTCNGSNYWLDDDNRDMFSKGWV